MKKQLTCWVTWKIGFREILWAVHINLEFLARRKPSKIFKWQGPSNWEGCNSHPVKIGTKFTQNFQVSAPYQILITHIIFGMNQRLIMPQAFKTEALKKPKHILTLPIDPRHVRCFRCCVMAVQRRRPTLKMNPRRESGDAELHKPPFFIVGGRKWHVTPVDYSGSGGRTFVRRCFCCTFFEVGVFFRGEAIRIILRNGPWAHPGPASWWDGDVFGR